MSETNPVETTYAKPLPSVEPGTEPFWEALREHKLIYQHCRACGHEYAPYQPVCPNCWSEDLEDRESCGRGTIYTFSTVYRAPTPAFKPDLPYVVALVELEEGFYLTTNIIDCPAEEVHIGLAVEVVYADVTPEVTLAKFKPQAA